MCETCGHPTHHYTTCPEWTMPAATHIIGEVLASGTTPMEQRVAALETLTEELADVCSVFGQWRELIVARVAALEHDTAAEPPAPAGLPGNGT